MVNFESNTKEVKNRLKQAKGNMLEAVGRAGVGHVKLVTPVDTGALVGSINHKTDTMREEVHVGSTLTSEMYPIYVHEGARGVGGRPYIRDGIMLNLGNIRTVAERNFKP